MTAGQVPAPNADPLAVGTAHRRPPARNFASAASHTEARSTNMPEFQV